ncbi:MAG: RNA polymerase sigma factor [Ilumatobacteraceae bacterium]
MDVGLSSDEVVYVQLAPELIRFATGLVGRDDAPDVMSTAFVKAMSSPSWRSVRDRRAFMYRAVLNEARTWTRRRATRPIREAAAAWRDAADEPAAGDTAVAEAVAALSLRQRAVIVLTYWADLPPADIADRLGISEGAVRRHLARARARLREVLHVD